MPPNSSDWQFNKGIVGIDFFALWCPGLQLGKLKWPRVRKSISIGSFFTHMSGCLVVAVGWSLCWICQMKHLCAVFLWGLAFSQYGGLLTGCLKAYDLASEVTESHCYHTLFIKGVIGLPEFKGRDRSATLWWISGRVTL